MSDNAQLVNSINNKFQTKVYNSDNILKDFYSLSEYYNFLKTPDNSITPQRLFSVVPFPVRDILIGEGKPTNAETGRAWNDGKGYTRAIFNTSNLKRFVMSIQRLDLLNFNMQKGDCKSNEIITTPIGSWRTLSNTTAFTAGDEFKAYIYEMQDPVIEHWLYDWYMACLQTNTGGRNYSYPFPRLDLAIKFYRTDSFYERKDLQESIETENGIEIIKYYQIHPIFVYWITGVYPDDIEASKYDHSAGGDGGAINRTISFGYNMMTCITESNAKFYKLEHLLNGTTITNRYFIKKTNKLDTPKKDKNNNNLYYWFDDAETLTNKKTSNIFGNLLNKFTTFSRGFNSISSYLPNRLNKSISYKNSYVKTSNITTIANNNLLQTSSINSVYSNNTNQLTSNNINLLNTTNASNTIYETNESKNNNDIVLKNLLQPTNITTNTNNTNSNTNITTTNNINNENNNITIDSNNQSINTQTSKQNTQQITNTNNIKYNNTQNNDKSNINNILLNDNIKQTQQDVNKINGNAQEYMLESHIENVHNIKQNNKNTEFAITRESYKTIQQYAKTKNINTASIIRTLKSTTTSKIKSDMITELNKLQNNIQNKQNINTQQTQTANIQQQNEQYNNIESTTSVDNTQLLKNLLQPINNTENTNTQQIKQTPIQSSSNINNNSSSLELESQVNTSEIHTNAQYQLQQINNVNINNNLSSMSSLQQVNTNNTHINMQQQLQQTNNEQINDETLTKLDNNKLVLKNLLQAPTDILNNESISQNEQINIKTNNTNNYKEMLEKSLLNILKSQRNTQFNIYDYQKQIEQSLNALNKSKSLEESAEQFKLQLEKALSNLNRKQAKKLTETELSLFVNSAQLIFNEQFK